MNTVVEQPQTDLREFITLPTSKGVSFDDLMKQAVDIDMDCEDFMLPNVTDVNAYFTQAGHLKYLTENGVRDSAMSRFALGQLCTKLGVPANYIDKCFSSGNTELAADNINSWMSTLNKSLFIREYQGNIRGILSDRYMTLDTPDILGSLTEVINPSEYQIKGYFMSPERFHARIVQKEMLSISGEDLFAGIQIDSSDVGRKSLVVRFLIFKQICTNGLCISKGGGVLFSQKHIGINLDEFCAGFKESMQRIPLLIDNATTLIEEARKDTSKYDVRHFSEQELKDFTDRMRFKTKLSEEGMNKVISFMSDKYGYSRWGFVNALTEVSQEYTLERRIELEKIAGDILAVA